MSNMQIQKESLNKAYSSFTATIKFLWLLLLYVSLLFLVVGTLSSYQFNRRINTYITDNNLNVNVAYVIQQTLSLTYIEDDIQRLESERSSLQTRRKTFEAQIERVIRDEEKAYDQLDALRSESWDELDVLLEGFGIDPDVISNLFAPSDYRYFWESEGRATATSDSNDQAAVQLFEERLNYYSERANSIQATLNFAGNVDEYNSELDTINNQIDEITPRLNELRRELEEQPELLSFAAEIQSLSRVCLSSICISSFTNLHSSVLVLLLTVTMGTLGSTIDVTRRFLANDYDMDLAWIFVRPLMGMATSISIYILAKTGQLTIAASPTGQELNPFFISFLAIVSGLLADKAVEVISSNGRALLDKNIKDSNEVA